MLIRTDSKQFKIAITFLTGYNGIFNVTNKNNKFYFRKSINDEDFIRNTILPGAYEIKGFDKEIKRPNFDENYFTEATHPFKNLPNFNTLGSTIEISPQGPIVSFASDDTFRSILGFRETINYKEYNLSHNAFGILSYDNTFVECDIAHGMIFRGKRSGVIHIFTMDVNAGFKYIENFRGGVQWYMIDTKVFISSINFKLKNENNKLDPFNG